MDKITGGPPTGSSNSNYKNISGIADVRNVSGTVTGGQNERALNILENQLKQSEERCKELKKEIVEYKNKIENLEKELKEKDMIIRDYENKANLNLR